MAGQLYAVGNSKIFIGSRVNRPKGAVTEADFTGEIWTEIGEWTAAGAIGDTQEVITQKVISSGRVRKAKGTRDAGTMENTFIPTPDDQGQIKFRQAIEDCKPYKFKIEWGAGCLPEFAFTATGTSAVLTAEDHGFVAGQTVTFVGNDLPAPLVAGTVYYVLPTGLADDTFQVSATRGGAAIATTDAGSGEITVVSQPIGQTDLFYGLALAGARQGGDADTAQLRTWSIAIDSNIVEV